MLISHEKEFIFIHIPRTGGTSIEKSICNALGIKNWKSFSGEPIEVINEGESQSNEWDQYNGWKHLSAIDLRAKVGGEIWNSYFKFSFVRNPWDRAVSTYFRGVKEQNKIIKWLWPSHKFLFKLSLILKYKILGKKGSQQVDFLTENNKILVDFVGRYEELQKDFKIVCNKIGIIADLNWEEEKTSHPPYIDLYNRRTIKIIQDVKRRDIDFFDYKFS